MKLGFKRLINSLKRAFSSFKHLLGLGNVTDEPIPLYAEPNLAGQKDGKSQQQKKSELPPAPEKRREILAFVIEKLRPFVDENRSQIEEIHLFLKFNTSEEELLLKVALYHGAKDGFKEKELHPALSNNYINTSKKWTFHYSLINAELPETCMFKTEEIGFHIIQSSHDIKIHSKVKLKVLVGQAYQDEYFLDIARQLTYLIGRKQTPQLDTGQIRTNDISFLDSNDIGFDRVKGEYNSSISRNHASIKFDTAQQKYFLYSEISSSGGMNKVKLLKLDGRVERVSLATLKYELSDGDQIQLGDAAIIEFKLI